MLAPLRDYLCPKDPMLSPLLCTTKEYYFARMSVSLNPNEPDFVKSQWIGSEDVNVEHLLDVFTTIDAGSDNVWRACVHFIRHLLWHKNRLVILRPKFEGLPDDHSSKPECLFELSRLLDLVGIQVERKRLLTCVLKLERERGNGHKVAQTLKHLADANKEMGLLEEGIELAKEALEVSEQLGDSVVQARCLMELGWLLGSNEQFDAAEEAAFRAIDRLPEKGEEYRTCQFHRILGEIYQCKGETEKAIHHSEVALGIASSFDWHVEPFWVHYDLALVFSNEGRFDEAHTHIERAKSHTTNSALNLAYAMKLHSLIWYEQDRLKEARSEALRAADVFEKFGAVENVEDCKTLLRNILDTAVASGQSDFNCELLRMALFPLCINSPI